MTETQLTFSSNITYCYNLACHKLVFMVFFCKIKAIFLKFDIFFSIC